ncbi:MAG: hypothetical protein GF346_01750 [Candidatus Eisenbacteria bacterium]|nr:hypothetical protein [Candidatus Latescibacterota bacterium]MBD3301155.1 hypothetical protein [Candidatus Eisenbacteria bacterium]
MRLGFLLAAFLIPTVVLVGCNDDDGPTDTGDTTPPDGVTDLAVMEMTEETATLVWTCPGDDGMEGNASVCDLRYSRDPITEATWSAAAAVAPAPEPRASGTATTHTIANLAPSTVYHFAVKHADEIPNWSPLSNTVTDTTLGDLSLILASSRAGHYAVVPPWTGADSVEVSPSVHFVGPKKLGHRSKRVFVISPLGPGGGVDVIYGCDTFTGANVQQVTSESAVDVLHLDGSPVEERLVFAGWDLVEDFHHVYVVGEDGTGLQQVTVIDEALILPDGTPGRLVSAGEPAWSPDGSQIAFFAGFRSVPQNFAHNVVAVMDASGANKRIFYERPVEQAHYEDACWTSDGQFLLFSVEDGGRKVRAVHLASGAVSDITSSLTSGTAVEGVWTSPYGMEIVYNFHLVGGGDLHVAQLKAVGSSLSVQGTSVQLTNGQAYGHGYGDPDWAPWDRWD